MIPIIGQFFESITNWLNEPKKTKEKTKVNVGKTILTVYFKDYKTIAYDCVGRLIGGELIYSSARVADDLMETWNTYGMIRLDNGSYIPYSSVTKIDVETKDYFIEEE